MHTTHHQVRLHINTASHILCTSLPMMSNNLIWIYLITCITLCGLQGRHYFLIRLPSESTMLQSIDLYSVVAWIQLKVIIIWNSSVYKGKTTNSVIKGFLLNLYFSSLPGHFVWNLTFQTPYIFWNVHDSSTFCQNIMGCLKSYIPYLKNSNVFPGRSVLIYHASRLP